MGDPPENNAPNPADLPNPLLAEPETVEPVASGVESAPVGIDAPKGRKAAAVFIFLTVSLDMLALGMIVPVLPQLITDFVHGNTSVAARWIGIFATLFAIMQFLFSPVLGSLSDRLGRRPIVLLSNFGLGADYVVMALAPTLPWLFLGRTISGLTASSVPTAMAYMADVTPHEKRAAAFGLLNAAFGIGFILGPALGGVLGQMNPRLPFWIAAGLSCANGLYGLFVLPESLPKESRGHFSWKRANPIGSLALFNSVKGLLPLVGLLLLGYIAQQSLNSAYPIYVLGRYGWGPKLCGLSLTLVGVITGIYGSMLVKPAVKKLGERGAMIWGYLGGMVGYWMLGFSKTGLLIWLGIPFLNLMSLSWPAAQAMMSRQVPPNQQGQLQGSVNSLRSIAGMLGPYMFTWIFASSIGAHPLFPSAGTTYYLSATLLIGGLLLTVFSPAVKRLSSRPA